MCKFAAIVLSGVVTFFIAWLCVFFIAGNVDVFTWKVENRFLALTLVLAVTSFAVTSCGIYYQNK